MKKRLRERVLILVLSLSVLLSSTGAYSVFAQTTGASEGNTTEFSSSTTQAAAKTNEQETTTVAQTEQSEPSSESKPNVVSEGGEIKSENLEGSGTKESPYRIADADDLFKMQAIVNDSSSKDKYFILTNDIDLSSVSYSQLRANKVLSGTIVSVDKSLSDAAPDRAKIVLNGRNFRIYGLNINNAGSAAVGIFGYIGANSIIKNVNFEDISITVSSESAVVNSAVVLYNNGEIRGCSLNNIIINVTGSAAKTAQSVRLSGSLKTDAATGFIALNAGQISDVVVNSSELTVAEKKNNVGLLTGENTGLIKNVYINDSLISAQRSVETGFAAGANNGKITDSTIKNVSAEIGEDSLFGAVAGTSSGMVASCVTSGSVTGSSLAGGIVGKAVSNSDEISATVANCYTFFKTTGNGGFGAVVASGDVKYKNNYWSSEFSGRSMAYENAVKDGDMARAARLFVIKNGSSKTIEMSAFSARFGDAAMAIDTGAAITYKESGVSLSVNDDSIKAYAKNADSYAAISYSLRTVVSVGYNSKTEITNRYTSTVLGVSGESYGNGLSEETALTISSGADLTLIKYAPFANFKLAKDVTASSNWEPFTFAGTLDGDGHTVSTAQVLFTSVTGSVNNLTVVMNGQVASAVFGDAIGAHFESVKYLKGSSANKDLFVGTVAQKDITGSFINKVYGYTDIINCFTDVPIYVNKSKVSDIGGLAGNVGFKGNNIINSGASVSIIGDEGADLYNTAALIGGISSNKYGTVKNCYATLYSDLTDYAIVGGGDSAVSMQNCWYGSSDNKAKAAPDAFKNVKASKWEFDAGDSGFISGKGSVITITLPKEIIDPSAAKASDFKASYDSKAVSVNTNGITIKNGVVYLPVEAAENVITVNNSSVALIHKLTGLRATISLSNGLEKDKHGNFIIANGTDFAFINENIAEYGSSSFVITNDIDMSGVEIAPVGGAADAFTGKLDGNGHKIIGLKLNSTAKTALFGTIDGAVIRNIIFDSAVISAAGSYAGVLAGQISGESDISAISFVNCKVKSNESYAGIIAGYINSSKISNIKVEKSSVSALGYAGIISGSAVDSEISKVNITESKAYSDNFAGSFGSTEKVSINNISAAGCEITSAKIAGGISASASQTDITDVTVSKCRIKAENISSAVNCASGGVSGDFSGTITNAKVSESLIYAVGRISAAGGIAAQTGDASIKNAVAESNCKITANVSGGIIGDASGKTSVESSASYAAVKGAETDYNIIQGAGGIIGRIQTENLGDVKIKNVNTSGRIYSYKYAGGLIGSILSNNSNGVSIADCITACDVLTSDEGIETSGKVIGFVKNTGSVQVESAVKSVIFSSYGSSVGAYGNVDAESTYIDLDRSVKSSLNGKITSVDEVKVTVSTDAAKYGFKFNSELGWQSSSSDKIAVISSSENEVTLKAAKNANVAVTASYISESDKNIALTVHFSASSSIITNLNGNGTSENPYKITDKDDLQLVFKHANSSAYFTLLTDIEFTSADFAFGGAYYNDGKGFIGFGTKEAPFNGEFNGNGHVISGIVSRENDEASFFGVTNNAVIKDLTIIDAKIDAEFIAAAVSSRTYDSTFSNISVTNCRITVQGADCTAAAIAGFSMRSQFEDIAVKGTEITALALTPAYSTAYAAGITARDSGSTINSVKVVEKTTVTSDGSAAGIAGLCDGTLIIGSTALAAVKGETASAIAANVKGSLSVSKTNAGGTVDASKYAGGIAAYARGPVKADNVTISAEITAPKKAVAIARADKSVYTDSAECEVSFDRVLYSSYQLPAEIFGDSEINAYQSASYLDGVIDVNTTKPVKGEFVAVGAQKAKIAEIVDFGKEASKFRLSAVISDPENLIEYNADEGTVTALATNVDNAELVMVYENGIKTAVKMISVKGMTGAGTKSSPYIISSEDTMLLLGVYPQAIFTMSNDVVMTKEWTPVENFTGTLDGNGYTITGLNATGENSGLFAGLSGSAVVKNIKLKNAVIKGKQSAGAVAAELFDNAQISAVEIITSEISAEKYAGAIVGSTDSLGAVISGCNVSGVTVKAQNAGGIAGIVSGTNTIKNSSVSSAEVDGEETAGGIIAIAEGNAVVDGVQSQANVRAFYAEGGIIGVSGKDSSVINSSAMSTLSGDAKHTAAIVAKFSELPEDNEDFAKNFNGNTTNGRTDEFEPAVIQYQNYQPTDSEKSKISLNGKGTEEEPYIISSARDLASIPDGAEGHFALDKDIKLGEEDYGFKVDEKGSTVSGAFRDGYRPIRNFAGVFDGKGHIISGLYINSTDDYVGLFANITGSAAVKNLHIEILSEEANLGYYGINGKAYVAGIAGYCDASGGIENCTVKGYITGSRAVGALAGGLASSKIDGCVASCDITAQSAAGGAVGIVTGTSSITSSVIACSVKSSGGSFVGINNGELNISDVLVNGASYGTGAVAIAENSGTVSAERMIITGANSDNKNGIMSAQKTENVYSDILKLKTSDSNITSLETGDLTSEKQTGLENWKHTNGSYPVPEFGDAYSSALADEAAKPIVSETKEEKVGNVSVDYTLINTTGDKYADEFRAGILLKSNVNGSAVTADFYTSSKSKPKKLYKLLVTSGGFFVDADLPEGYGVTVTAKDEDGKEINVTDAKEKGYYVSLGAKQSVSLEISIIKVEKPWGYTSVWKSFIK